MREYSNVLKKEATVKHVSMSFYSTISKRVFFETYKTYNLIQSPGALREIPTITAVGVRSDAPCLTNTVILICLKSNIWV